MSAQVQEAVCVLRLSIAHGPEAEGALSPHLHRVVEVHSDVIDRSGLFGIQWPVLQNLRRRNYGASVVNTTLALPVTVL